MKHDEDPVTMKRHPKALLSYGFIARHGAAIERLREEMISSETRDDLLEMLTSDAANLVYGFLIATGNQVSLETRDLRNDVAKAILDSLSKHGIDEDTFRIFPTIPPNANSGMQKS